MGQSFDSRNVPVKVRPALRGAKRTGPIGSIVPGDDVEVARDIQRIWQALVELRRRPAGGGAGSGHHSLLVTVDGLGRVPVTGVQADAPMDFDGTIVGWTLVADQTGSVVVDIWKDVLASFPPVDADTITGGDEVALSSGLTASADQTDLAAWTTSFLAGDVLRFNVDSVSGLTRFVLALAIEED